MPDSPPNLRAYPAGVTFHQLIARNKRNTVLLVMLMGSMTVGVILLIAAAIMTYAGGEVSPEGLAIAAAMSIGIVVVSTLWSYYGGASTLLSIAGAVPIEKADDPQLFNIVEELSIAGGLPMPRVYLIRSEAMNAFATGRDPDHAAVAITTGLRRKLNRDELAGVMAHELAHVRHYDIRLTMMIATMVGLIVLACDVFLRTAFHSSRGSRRSSGGGRSGGGGGGAAVVLIVLALLLAIIAPLLAKLIQLAVSRQREYLADAGAVELTRNPAGLAGALRKLDADHTPLESANRATAHLYIDNPFLQARGKTNWNSIFSTHPPMDERIRRIEALLR